MATKTINDLTAVTSLAGDEAIPVMQGGVTKRATPQQVLAGASAEVSAAAYTFVLADGGSSKRFNRATAQTITIPANSAVAFPVGTRIPCWRVGAGLVTIAGDGGVTLRLPTGIRPNRTMAAQINKSGAQANVDFSGSGANVAFDAEVYDTDAFHDTVTNNSRITIPSGLGIKKVRIVGGFQANNFTAEQSFALRIYKNGAELKRGCGTMWNDSDSSAIRAQAVSGSIAVAAADYFELHGDSTGDTAVDVDAETSFSLEVTEIDPVGSIAYQYGRVELEKIGTDEWILGGPALG